MSTIGVGQSVKNEFFGLEIGQSCDSCVSYIHVCVFLLYILWEDNLVNKVNVAAVVRFFSSTDVLKIEEIEINWDFIFQTNL